MTQSPKLTMTAIHTRQPIRMGAKHFTRFKSRKQEPKVVTIVKR